MGHNFNDNQWRTQPLFNPKQVTTTQIKGGDNAKGRSLAKNNSNPEEMP